MELFKVVTIDEAKDIIKNNFGYKIDFEEVNILECCGRILCEDVLSGENIPNFKRSTVDGYAVNAADVAGASESIPAVMDYRGEVQMGMLPSSNLAFPGDCIYVPTGGMLPEGSDSVVMIEYTDKLDSNTILINSPVACGDNVIQLGEDIHLGEIVLKSGTKIRPYEVGVLSSLGIDRVKVFRRPKVAIISTGDEIVDITSTPKLGEIRDINTYLLYSSLLEYGAIPINYGIIKDDFDLLKLTVHKAVNECDIVLISGGSSVGKKDQTLEVMKSFQDGEILIHGIAVKPGKPTIVGKANGKIIFGLPGHPLACSVMYSIFVKSYLDTLSGTLATDYPVSAEFTINYHKSKGREEYLPVTLEFEENKLKASPVFGKSGLISVYAKAWGIIRIPRNIEGLRAGEPVQVFKL